MHCHVFQNRTDLGEILDSLGSQHKDTKAKGRLWLAEGYVVHPHEIQIGVTEQRWYLRTSYENVWLATYH